MTQNPVIDTYDKWSTTYDSHPNPLIPIEELAVRSLLRTIPCTQVLDAATGTGRYALYFAQQGKQVTAVDASAGMLAEAKMKAQREHLTINFQQEDITHLPFPGETFDLVICALALSHQPSLIETCQELVRVLQSGGNLIISDLHPWFQGYFGTDHKLELQGEYHPYPVYHPEVEDYRTAVAATGATVFALLDVPSRWIPPEGEHIAIPGALILWAKKP